MKNLMPLMVIAISACSQSHQFEHQNQSQSDSVEVAANIDATPAPEQSDSQPVLSESGSDSTEVISIASNLLTLSPASFSVKAGGQPIAFVASLEGHDFRPNVSYSLLGNSNGDLGSISPLGVYTPPQKIDSLNAVEILATLKSKPDLSANTAGMISPQEALFVPCQEDDLNQTIVADLYDLDEGTAVLPNFANLQSMGSVCLDQIAISRREFSQGFPGVSDKFEWFALVIKTALKVPESGTMTLAINSDDGSKVYLDGELVIDNDGIHAEVLESTEVIVTKGVHELTIEYFQGPRYYIALEFFWQLPSQNNLNLIGKQYFGHPSTLKGQGPLVTSLGWR